MAIESKCAKLVEDRQHDIGLALEPFRIVVVEPRNFITIKLPRSVYANGVNDYRVLRGDMSDRLPTMSDQVSTGNVACRTWKSHEVAEKCSAGSAPKLAD